MRQIEAIERLKEFNKLINKETTGNAATLAIRFHICERNIYYILEQMRELGANIKFDSIRQTYYYENDFKFF
jgi:predicted DNA-binding transcriptional regulator YafY